MMNELDTKNRIYQAERRARAEALAEGLKEGREETARKMKAKGIDVKTISECTGLTLEQLAVL